MNILFLTLFSIEDLSVRGIYTDLINELANRGINIYVVTPREMRTGLPTELSVIGSVHLLKVSTGNITKTSSFIKKGLVTLQLENQYLKALKKYCPSINFNMVMYSTPPIVFEKIVRYFKKRYSSKTFLILKDIFPQNAVDIGIIKKNSFLWKFFRNKEKRLYEMSDKIGCMSKENVKYILAHNPEIPKEKVEVFPNSIKPIEPLQVKEKNLEIFSKFNIISKLTVFIYGGNLGKPQGIDFLLEVISHFHLVRNSHLIIVGSGTEYRKIKKYINNAAFINVSLYDVLQKEEYDQLLTIADVGLIFLDKRFTIPNFPSRLLSYMENSLPILAATDKNTDLKDVLKESGSGFWVESGDINSFIKYANILSEDKDLRKKMGLKGRKYLEINYNIKKNVDSVITYLKENGVNYV